MNILYYYRLTHKRRYVRNQDLFLEGILIVFVCEVQKFIAAAPEGIANFKKGFTNSC